MYEMMYDFNNIREGYRLARSCKPRSKEVALFDADKIYNLKKLQNQLEKKFWDDVFVYKRFYIREPKLRKVDALTFPGRIAQHVLCDNIIHPYIEPRLIYENAACRPGKGTDFARNMIKRDLLSFIKHHESGYVLKIDVAKYFDSINHDILKSMLTNFPNKEVLEFIYYIIDNVPDTCGLPLGNQTSQWMALYYLNPLDRIIKEKFRVKYYSRYMDDFIIIHESKTFLHSLLDYLTVYASNKLKLRFNDKTQIIPLHKGFTYLGWKYKITSNNGVRLYIDNSKVPDKVKKIHDLRLEYQFGEIPLTKYEERKTSHYAHLGKGETYFFCRKHLKELE